MKTDRIVQNKSLDFSVAIVDLYKQLAQQNEYILGKQILCSGTSVGANIREADHAESNADFIYKMSIAPKESNETLYWLEILVKTTLIKQQRFENLNDEAITR